MVEKSAINGYVAMITPGHARALLEQQRTNRRLRTARVTAYAQAMREGLWQMSEIRVDSRGRLVDGQHRLQAVIAYGAPVPFRVLVCSDAEVEVIDTGAVRSQAERWTIHGDTSGMSAADLQRLCAAYRYLFVFFQGNSPEVAQAWRTAKPWAVEGFTQEIVCRASNILGQRAAAALVAGVALGLGSIRSPSTAWDREIAAGYRGENLAPGSALHTWDRFLRARRIVNGRGAVEAMYATAHAVLHHLTGSPLQKLYVPSRALLLARCSPGWRANGGLWVAVTDAALPMQERAAR